MTEIKKVDVQTQAQNTQQTQQAKPKYEPVKTSVWDLIKAGWEGFTGYYAEKFEGTQGIGDALSRTYEIYNEGAAGIDKCTFNKVKDPIKEWSRGIEAKLDDGDDSHLSMGERLWAGAQGVGAIPDALLSTKGITVTAAAGAAVAGLAAGAVATAGAIGGEAAAATTSAAIGVAANAAGTVGGTVLAGKGTYDIAAADTKEQAQKGGTELGSGAIMLGASAATAKQTLTAAREAGIQAGNPENMSTVRAMAENVKVAPKAVAQAVGAYKPAPFTTLITANSPELANATQYMSKPNEVKAYRFNPNGSEEEILANNPNVFKTADGKFAIPNKWNPNEPYIIDPSKEQMIMMYGGDDFAVCEGSVFKGSYVDTAGFKANGALNYQDPSKLQYGQVVDVTKQAPGRFVNAPVGTEVKTLEGIRTVGEGDVIAIDHAGNPYVTTKANIIKRNIVSQSDPAVVLDNENYIKFVTDGKVGRLSSAENARLEEVVKSSEVIYGDKIPEHYTGRSSVSYDSGVSTYDHDIYYLDGKFIKQHSDVPMEKYTRYADNTKIADFE